MNTRSIWKFFFLFFFFSNHCLHRPPHEVGVSLLSGSCRFLHLTLKLNLLKKLPTVPLLALAIARGRGWGDTITPQGESCWSCTCPSCQAWMVSFGPTHVEVGLVLGSITTADVLGGIGGSSDTGGLQNHSYSLQQSTA